MTDFERERRHMVERHIARRGVREPRVLEAFLHVPREAFVPERLAASAYDDAPLPIGRAQTISQPYIVAFTVDALRLRGGERVLEVGTGSGYAAAILGCIAAEVWTIERLDTLADSARERLARLGYANVHVVLGDGSLGLPAHAPYDAIAVAAGGPKAPPALLEQLAVGGRLVIPVGVDAVSQSLVRYTRTSETDYDEEILADVTFVPLIGAAAWPEADAAAPLRESLAPVDREGR